MPNQRPPNSFHHENALLSDLVINETPKLRTQPIRAWHSRNERLTPHIPAQAELPPQESGDNSSKAGCQKFPLGRKQKKNLSLFHQKTCAHAGVASCDHNSRLESLDFHAEPIPIHSPLLREYYLVSFPPLTYMLKFSRFSGLTSCLRIKKKHTLGRLDHT